MAQAIHKRRKVSDSASAQVTIDDNRLLQLLAGQQNAHLKIIERQLDVQVHLRGNQLTISGDRADVEIGERLLMNWRTWSRAVTLSTKAIYSLRFRYSVIISTAVSGIFFSTRFL